MPTTRPTCQERGCTKPADFAFHTDGEPDATIHDEDAEATYCAEHAQAYADDHAGEPIRGLQPNQKPAEVPHDQRGGMYRDPETGRLVELDPDEEGKTWHRDPFTGAHRPGPHPEGV